jgi:sporulation protein YlmC with PRC-barrel domain
MLTPEETRNIRGKAVVAADGEKLGKVDALYADARDGRPTFATINTGLFATKTQFVPLESAMIRGSDIVVPYDRGRHQGCTERRRRRGADSAGGSAPVRALCAERRHERRPPAVAGSAGSRARDGDNPVTVSEEQLRVGTRRTETGRARLRKFVTTDTETVHVPVTKEHVTLEREPIRGDDADTQEPVTSEDEREIVLTE